MVATITFTSPKKGDITITHGAPPLASSPVAYKVKSPLVRKTDKPRSSTDLKASLSLKSHAISDLHLERAALAAEMSLCDDDPDRKEEIHARVDDIDAELIGLQRSHQSIQTAILIAEQREEAERQAADRAEQEKKTAKLARGGAARFNAVAKAYADVLHELKEDEAAWNLLGAPGMSAYRRIRTDNSGARPTPSARSRQRLDAGRQLRIRGFARPLTLQTKQPPVFWPAAGVMIATYGVSDAGNGDCVCRLTFSTSPPKAVWMSCIRSPTPRYLSSPVPRPTRSCQDSVI